MNISISFKKLMERILTTHMAPHVQSDHHDIIWNKITLLNVSLFTWTLLNKQVTNEVVHYVLVIVR
jgi:hypothetical protein